MPTSIVSLVAGVALLAPAGQDAVQLSRTYTKDETSTHLLKVSMKSDSGGSMSIDSTISSTVTRLFENGKAEVSRKLDAFKMTKDGEEIPEEAPGVNLSNFDARGLPETVDAEDGGIVYAIHALLGQLPNKSVKAGDSYDIDWKADGDSFHTKGKGKFEGVVEYETKKAWKISVDLKAAPHQETEANVTYTAYFNPENGQLLKAEGKAEIPSEGVFNFSLKLKPKA
jgi:hypothetical protein